MSAQLFEKVLIKADGKVTEYENIPDIWRAFGWDIKKNKTESQAATSILRALLVNGEVDLSDSVEKGHTLILQIVPVSESEV